MFVCGGLRAGVETEIKMLHDGSGNGSGSGSGSGNDGETKGGGGGGAPLAKVFQLCVPPVTNSAVEFEPEIAGLLGATEQFSYQHTPVNAKEIGYVWGGKEGRRKVKGEGERGTGRGRGGGEAMNERCVFRV